MQQQPGGGGNNDSNENEEGYPFNLNEIYPILGQRSGVNDSDIIEHLFFRNAHRYGGIHFGHRHRARGDDSWQTLPVHKIDNVENLSEDKLCYFFFFFFSVFCVFLNYWFLVSVLLCDIITVFNNTH